MKIGTIGTGPIVSTFLEAVAQIEGIDCVAIYSRTKSKGEKLAKKFQVDAVYTDLDQMFANENINFVYVASPNSLHYEYTLQALRSGKNVICEKPFTSTVEETKALIELALSKNLFLFEAITNIHLPNFKLLEKQIARLGKIKVVQANYSQYSSRYDQLLGGEVPNVFNPKFSGGALMDIGIYNIHFIMRLFGEPISTKYFPNKHENGIDTSGTLILEYPEFVATAVAAKDTWGKSFVQIQGEQGFIYVPQGPNGGSAFTLQLNGEKPEEYNMQENTNLLYYELLEFKQIYLKQARQTCYDLLDYSKTIIETLETARKTGGIVFAADRKKNHS